MDIANRIVFELVGPSTEASYLERLENRPDWQRYVGLVRMMIDDELFDLRNERDEWKELHRRDLANELHQQARAEAAEAEAATAWAALYVAEPYLTQLENAEEAHKIVCEVLYGKEVSDDAHMGRMDGGRPTVRVDGGAARRRGSPRI